MGDVRYLLKMHFSRLKGRTVEDVIPEWIRAQRPFDSVKEDHCLFCGVRMSPEEQWPDGLTPRCMHDSCYHQEIVCQTNYVDWLDKRTPLGQDKIRGQKVYRRELQYNFADGASWLYFLILANKVIGALEYYSNQPRHSSNYAYHALPNISDLEIPPSRPFNYYLPPPEPRMTVDELLAKMRGKNHNQPEYSKPNLSSVRGADEYKQQVLAMYQANHFPGEDFESWKVRRQNEVMEDMERKAEAMTQEIYAKAAAVNSGPDLGAAHMDPDGNLLFTRYVKGDRVWVEYPDGRIEWE